MTALQNFGSIAIIGVLFCGNDKRRSKHSSPSKTPKHTNGG